MNRFLMLAAVGLLGVSACDKDDTDDSDTAIDTDVPLSITYNWDTDGYTSVVTGLIGSGFDVGFAETGSDGVPWNGEDCFNGTEGYTYCHGVTGNTAEIIALGTTGAPARDPDNVVDGQYTLLNKDLAYNGDGTDRLTYMVTFDDASCVTWGDDTNYYASKSCTAAPIE